MRNVDRVVLRTLSLAFATTGFIVACSSANSDTPGGNDGGPNPEGGVLPDGATTEGGPDAPAPPQPCTKNDDCPSKVCNIAKGLCEQASCKDATKNANETDLDCGGGDCPKCDTSKVCKVAGDCISGVCKDTGTGLKCQAPTNTDGVKNGNETGIDCGGTGNPKCPNGQGCKLRDDCTSDYCKTLVCSAILPGDGEQNGNETDIDCGGAGNARCNDGLKCLVDEDCKSDVCKDLADGLGKRCQVPSPTDGKKNGTETDVDCGGGGASPGCATGKICLVGGDCTSLGCNASFKCAAGRSCTNPGGYGAETCGFGGAGSIGAAEWEDCCARAPVTATTGPTAGQVVQVDKYQVTAGRMRVFLESVGYNVRAFVQQARADGRIPLIPGNGVNTVLEAAWDPYLATSFAGNVNAGELADCDQSGAETPTSTVCTPGSLQPGIYTSIRNHLGGTIFKGNNQSSTGCFVGTPAKGGGTHAFRFPNGMQDGGPPVLDQNEYDMRSMQCIDYLTAQAFCVWDGGRLVLGQEHIGMWGAQPMPWGPAVTLTPAQPAQRCDIGSGVCLTQGDGTYWGCRFPWATDAVHNQCGLTWPATTTIEYAAYRYLFEYPKVQGSANEYDYIPFITPPGRTRGRGPAGHADIIGGNMSITSNVVVSVADPTDPQLSTHTWTSGGSWEVHGYSKPANGAGFTSNLLNKYGKLGLRCAYP